MKLSKRIISLTVCLVMLFATMSLGLSAVAVTDDGYVCGCDETPIIYIKGRTNIYKDPSLGTSSENMAETNLSGGTDSIIEAATNILPAFGVALLTDEWDDYCDVLFEEIRPIYDGYKLNNDGEKGEGNTSGIATEWELENIIAHYESENVRYRHKGNATYWAQFMQFQYDMRLDPRDNADDLNTLIEAAKILTGHDKVNIICRCEGNVIVNAYLNEYGYDDIEGVVMYNSIAMGAEIADEMYTNKVELDPDAMNRFVNTFIDTSPILDFVKETVNLATYNGLMDDGLGFVKDIYDKISLNLIPRLIREIFGLCPGWWGMISPEVCDEAVEFVLESDNADGKYDKLIEKIYGYNELKKNAVNILKEAQADGVKVYVLTKYGDQMYPCIESYDALGDGVVSLYKQSFEGATTSKITDKLSDEYIQSRVEAGFGKYISADKMVDGSTAPFADYTWYIKELEHHEYPWCTDFMMLDLLNSSSYVKATDTLTGKYGTYTQYMLFEDYIGKVFELENQNVGKLHPLTEENKDDIKDTTDTSSPFAVLIKWFTAFFNFIASLFKK